MWCIQSTFKADHDQVFDPATIITAQYMPAACKVENVM